MQHSCRPSCAQLASQQLDANPPPALLFLPSDRRSDESLSIEKMIEIMNVRVCESRLSSECFRILLFQGRPPSQNVLPNALVFDLSDLPYDSCGCCFRLACHRTLSDHAYRNGASACRMARDVFVSVYLTGRERHRGASSVDKPTRTLDSPRSRLYQANHRRDLLFSTL